MRARLLDPDFTGHDGFIIAGQSNAVGLGNGGDQVYLDTQHPRIKQWAGSGGYLDQMVAAFDPLLHHVPSSAFSQGVGFGLTFAKAWLRRLPPNRDVCLIPCGHSATGFTINANLTWDPADATPGVTNLYQFMLARVVAFLASDPNNQLQGLLWCQGDQDMTAGMSQATYAAKLDSVIDGLRATVSDSTLPVVVIGSLPDALPHYTTGAEINTAHIDTPRRKTRTAFVYGPSGPAYYRPATFDLLPAHYNAPGMHVLGNRIPAGMLRARANILDDPPTPTGLKFVQSGTTVTVSWDQPTGRVTDYLVEKSTDGGTTWTTVTRTSPDIDVSASFVGVIGSTVRVRVSAINELGTSPPSTVGIYRLLFAPGQAGAAAGTPTVSAIPITITPPATDSTHDAAAQYLVEFKAHSSGVWLAFGTVTGTAVSVTGLSPSTSYDVRVTASNPAGSGPASTTVTASTAVPTALLSDVGVAAAYAYSVARKLSSTYAGSAFRVRRSNDNAEQDIGFTGAGALDVAALLAFIGSNSGYIKTLYDQSGNARDLTQATAARQARIVNAGFLDSLNTVPAAVMNTSYWSGAFGVMAAAGAESVLTVFGSTATCVVATEVKSAANASRIAAPYISAAGASGAIIVNDANTSELSSTGGQTMALDGALHQVSLADSGSLASTWVDGQVGIAAAYARSGTHATDKLALGCFLNSGVTPQNYVAGSLCEWVGWAVALNATQRTAGEANQRSWYLTP